MFELDSRVFPLRRSQLTRVGLFGTARLCYGVDMVVIVAVVVIIVAIAFGQIPDPLLHALIIGHTSLAITPPLGATALVLFGPEQKTNGFAYIALTLWAIALAAAIGASISSASGWGTLINIVFESPTAVLWGHIANITALSALTIGALVGARAAQRRARFTTNALLLTALVGGFAVLRRLIAGPLGDPGDNGLTTAAALMLPAVGVLGSAVHTQRWRGPSLAWAIVALSTLGAGLVRTLIDLPRDLPVEEVVHLDSSPFYYFFFTAVAGLLGGIVVSRAEAFGRRALWTAVGFALGAHTLCAVEVIGAGSLSKNLADDVFAYMMIPKMLGGVLVLSVALWVLWSLRGGSRIQREAAKA